MARRKSVLSHNEVEAEIWNLGGADYQKISQSFTDAIEHCIHRLDPKPGEKILDLACGTGWASQLIAMQYRKVRVFGVDIANHLVAEAKRINSRHRLNVRYTLGDAERLPYPRASFDAAISTFGIPFVTHPEAAASELTRVCKRTARFAFTAWEPNRHSDQLGNILSVNAGYGVQKRARTGFSWSNPSDLKKIFKGFQISVESDVTFLRTADEWEAGRLWLDHCGPKMAFLLQMSPAQRKKTQSQIAAYFKRFRQAAGVAFPRPYSVVVVRR